MTDVVWTRDFQIVSFYTPDYQSWAHKLMESIDRWCPDIHYEVVPIANRTWREATCFKAEFIADKLISSRGSASAPIIVWIDADAEIVSGDLKFPVVDFSIFARWTDRLRKTHAPFRTGTVAFSRSQASRDLVDRWIAESLLQKDGIDQWSLFRAWCAVMQKGQASPSSYWLDRSYCMKYDEPGLPKIRHLMASRRMRGRKGG